MRLNNVGRKKLRLNLNVNYRLRNFFAPKRVAAKVILLLIIILIAPLSINYTIDKEYSGYIYAKRQDIPPRRVAIVFGAGLKNFASEPSPILQDRIDAAVKLYKIGKVQKIIMSGATSENYSEPKIMARSARKQGVSKIDLQVDLEGHRTYDTCFRAREIFGVSEAILITQEYHLPRALYICNTLGLDAIGFKADKQIYQGLRQYKLREFFATVLSFWELYIDEPEVVLGEEVYI